MLDTAFLKPETWGLQNGSVEHVETHAAHVFIAGDRAYKIKKPVRLPYLDFSDIETRRAVIKHEFEINRSFAPDIYLGVSEVRGEPVLVMRRFASSALLSRRLGKGGLGVDLAVKLAAMAAAAHAAAPRCDVSGAGIMSDLGAQLSKAFVSSPDIFQPAATLEFHALYEAQLLRRRSLLNQRSNKGLVRRCHGDMHTGNIVVEDDAPKLFDAIEFSDRIATIDVLYDLAFLLMDLWWHDEKVAANAVLNRYMLLRRDEESLNSLALLPLFLSTRAGVRALVTADLAHELPLGSSMKPRGQALDWFRASLAFLKPEPPRLICIGGLSGTGKSTLAAALAPEIGAAPGAIHMRSDVERKVLSGVAETDRLPLSAYSRESSISVYSACFTRAAEALKAGQSVVIDAVFARDGERYQAEQLARETGVTFQGFWLTASEETLVSRVAQRQGDASDATPEVVRNQLGYDLGNLRWARIDAGGTPRQTLERLRERLPCPRAVPA